MAEDVDFEVLASRPAVGGRLVDIAGVHDRYDEIFLPLHGSVQAHNAAVAVAAVESFFDRALEVDLVRDGLALVRLEGRVEVVSHQPLVILDGAHNPDALSALGATLDEEFSTVGSRVVVLGLLAGRDPDAAVAAVRSLRPDLVVCTSADAGSGCWSPQCWPRRASGPVWPRRSSPRRPRRCAGRSVRPRKRTWWSSPGASA